MNGGTYNVPLLLVGLVIAGIPWIASPEATKTQMAEKQQARQAVNEELKRLDAALNRSEINLQRSELAIARVKEGCRPVIVSEPDGTPVEGNIERSLTIGAVVVDKAYPDGVMADSVVCTSLGHTGLTDSAGRVYDIAIASPTKSFAAEREGAESDLDLFRQYFAKIKEGYQ